MMQQQEVGIMSGEDLWGTTWTTEEAIRKASLMAQGAQDAARRARNGLPPLPPVHSPVGAGFTTDATQSGVGVAAHHGIDGAAEVDTPALSHTGLRDALNKAHRSSREADRATLRAFKDMSQFLRAKDAHNGTPQTISEEHYSKLIGQLRPHGTPLDPESLNWMRRNNVVPAPGKHVGADNFELVQRDVMGQIDGYTGYTWTTEKAIKQVYESAAGAQKATHDTLEAATRAFYATPTDSTTPTDALHTIADAVKTGLRSAADAGHTGLDAAADTVQTGLNSAADAAQAGVQALAAAGHTAALMGPSVTLSFAYSIVRRVIAENLTELKQEQGSPSVNKAKLAHWTVKLLLGSFQDPKALIKELEGHGLQQGKVMVGMEGDFVEGLMHAFATGSGSAAITVAAESLFGPGGFVVGLVVSLFYMATMLNRQLRADLGGYNFASHQRARFMAWSLKQLPLISSLALKAGERIAAFRKRHPKAPYRPTDSPLEAASPLGTGSPANGSSPL